MRDAFGRRIHYLRISLTDACNLRCVYCMPEGVRFRPLAELLQDDEIVAIGKFKIQSPKFKGFEGQRFAT